MSPWDVTPAEARAMDAMCEHGCYKLACAATGLSRKTIETHVCRVGKKMRARTVIGKYVAWDRWRRSGAPTG